MKIKGRFLVHFVTMVNGIETHVYAMRKGKGQRMVTPDKQYAGRFAYKTAFRLSCMYAERAIDKTCWTAFDGNE